MAPATRSRKRVLDSDEEDDAFADAVFTQFLNSSQAAAPPGSLPSPVKNGARVSFCYFAWLGYIVQRSNGFGSYRQLTGSQTKTTLSSAASPTRIQKKAKTEEKSRASDLVALFSQRPLGQISTDTQQLHSHTSSPIARRPRRTPPPRDLELNDAISDDDDDIKISATSSCSLVGQRAQKRQNNGRINQRPLFSPRKPTPSPTKSYRDQPPISKFTLPGPRDKPVFARPESLLSVKKETTDDDLRPWSERFAPQNLDELAVHKRKVADVRRWLSDALDGRIRQRILLLKGAAGTGKTTTVRLLAQNMGFNILEWKNPASGLLGNRQSAAAQFESFIGVGGTFGTLDTDEPEETIHFNAASVDEKSRRIILIEEFPNTYMRSSHILSAFRNALLEFLMANVPSLSMFAKGQVKKPIVPIVIVVSETLLTTTSASADSFTAHRLLGPNILRHPGTATIEFNNIAPSILTKALELVVTKEAHKSFRKRTPGPLVLKRLGEIGDIRNAVASLEFLCLKGDQDGNWGARVLFSKPKKVLREVALTAAEKETLEQVSQRESSLGIFHAVGKVVYNKRLEVNVAADSPEIRLPPQHARLMPPQVNVDTLIDEIGTDTSTFVSALHENYALSCTQNRFGDDLPTSVDHLNACIDALSDSDMLCPSWDVFFGGRKSPALSSQDSGSYILRQDEMAFQVAVRGLLHGLPHPVTRNQPGRGAPDAFKMFYPASIKLWRTREEVECLLDMCAAKLLHVGRLLERQPRSITAGASMFQQLGAARSASLPREPHNIVDSPTPPLSLGSVSRAELVLERLPGTAAVLRGARTQLAQMPLQLADVERIVSFQGIDGAVDDEADSEAGGQSGEEDGLGGMSQWATDRPAEEAGRKKSRGRMGIRRQEKAGDVEVEIPVQKLVLSDDDIED
ncbi:hypothetical protein TD95_002984 [Thielaviopsis punctulata]|uniref:Checkpoint protein RAD24-like helical bundle domain-containing protein n=1 Tax=Thielaviopsis punctulata TaxID=72032 RepID=A0A0F4ZIP1_9PEZI|nr:hypothetical protein TD95_002984 [Thielaviopsis punctulata]